MRRAGRPAAEPGAEAGPWPAARAALIFVLLRTIRQHVGLRRCLESPISGSPTSFEVTGSAREDQAATVGAHARERA